ncbi:MAG: OsmC family protein [Burkholderiaceae bacterium]|nr:OsmC family protein [Burkholderiaceae bacterium]
MSEDPGFSLELRQQADYRFAVEFDAGQLPPLLTDEPPPLGGGTGPNPARLLGAAVANCLAASLLFALRKFKNNNAEPLRARATVTLARNPQGRLRVGRIAVELHLAAAARELRAIDRVLAQFEDFCIVTQSVRTGIQVDVTVIDGEAAVLKAPAESDALVAG